MLERIVSTLRKVYVQIAHGWIECLSHHCGMTEGIVAPQPALLFREVRPQYLADLRKLWVHCWIATEDTDETEVVFQATAGQFEVLQRHVMLLASELTALRAVAAGEVAGSGQMDLHHTLHPLTGTAF